MISRTEHVENFRAIDRQTVKKYTRDNVRSMQWDAYYELEEIYAWIDDLAKTYPDIVTTEVAGTSYEGIFFA